MYAELPDGDLAIPAIPPKWLSERNKRTEVDDLTEETPGTIIVDPFARYLYLVLQDNRAMRYGVAVGEEGRGFSGEATTPYTRGWPSWTPTQNMFAEDPEQYGPVRDGPEGGLENPLGARALSLFQNGQDTLYRIHGTARPLVDRAGHLGRLHPPDPQGLADLRPRLAARHPTGARRAAAGHYAAAQAALMATKGRLTKAQIDRTLLEAGIDLAAASAADQAQQDQWAALLDRNAAQAQGSASSAPRPASSA